MSIEYHYPIVIVGGGLVGNTLACALSECGFRIALIEKEHSISKTVSKENLVSLNARALALSYSNIQFLRKLKILENLSISPEPISTVEVSYQGRFGMTHLKAGDLDLPELGSVFDADDLLEVLKKRTAQQSNVDLYCPMHILSIDRDLTEDSSWILKLSNGKNISTSLILAADGAKSFVRSELGIKVVKHHYKQKAIVVNIELQQNHQNKAFERFLDEGSLAMLPFGDRRVKCIWVASDQKTQELMELEDKTFLSQVQDQFGFKLGRFKNLGKRTLYPLESSYAESLYGDRLLLMGNAATTVHPIAAQGFNLALRDIDVFAECVLKIQKECSNLDLGSTAFLKNYAKMRITDHKNTRKWTDRLVKWPNAFLQAGILACEGFGLVKKAVLRQGVGICTISS